MSRNNHRVAQSVYLELEAAQLPVHEQMRTICPACGGGSSKERSLLLTRELWGIRAHCFRASCNYSHSVTGVGGAVSDDHTTPARSPITPYTGTFEPLEASDVEYFYERFGLDKMYVPYLVGRNSDNQYVMPILGRLGTRRGFVVRQTPWSGYPTSPRKPTADTSSRPKVRSWPNFSDTVMLSIYRNASGPAKIPDGTLVLTEDQISAMKAAQVGAIGAALLGVGLNLDKVRELQKLHPKRVLIALDPDASHLAFQMVNKWAGAFRSSMQVVLPDADLKDMHDNDIIELIGRDG